MGARGLPSAIERERWVRKGEAESLVVADGRVEAGAAGERSSERRRQWRAAARTATARRRERERESEWRSASGSGEGGRHGRAHLVADQGASTPAHARHAATERCWHAMASRRGRPRARTRCWRGEGVTRGRAGPASASGPEARPRPAGAPLSLLYFLNFFF